MIKIISRKKLSLFLSVMLGASAQNASAQGQFDLLEIPARESRLAHTSIITNMSQLDGSVLAVGERGHILTWTNPDSWQQHKVPVSLTLTDIVVLTDGSRFAVGHNSVILKSEPQSDVWQRVFDGYELTKLKITYISRKIDQSQQQLSQLSDDMEIDELQFNIEELQFNLEDAQAELEDGPNKPLLSIAVSKNNTLFAVGAYGTLLSSTDAGKTWQLIDGRVDNPDQFHLNSIETADNGDLYIVGENGIGFTSKDNGQTWQTMDMPYDGSLFGIATRDDSLVAFGLQGNFMWSRDNGLSWQASNIGNSASLLGGIIGPDMTVNLVGHGGVIVRFKLDDISTLSLDRHPSGAVFSSVLIRDNSLVLAGQFGMTTWMIK